ncbi:uncharacterized protein cd93 [Genypterus blacodes]|uniref:uncharacterized protein cd93 n=1 Tax=Genypterus blacodes TaxID=154954 RepID=UPI003F76BCD7
MLLVLLLQLIGGCEGLSGGAEPETVCTSNACFTLHTDRLSFEGARQNCVHNGGYLMTVRDREEEKILHSLLSRVERQRQDRTLKFWIGLRLHKGDCVVPHRTLRGFKWVSVEEDSTYSNWERDPVSTCTEERCVRVHYSLSGQNLLKWVSGPCKIPTFYVCKFYFKGMCEALALLGPGQVTYTAPFSTKPQGNDMKSLPLGTYADILCDDQQAHYSVCMATNSSYSWTVPGPFCKAAAPDCDFKNGGCAHECTEAFGGPRCSCQKGYDLDEDGFSCKIKDDCGELACEHRCVKAQSGPSCGCPEGFQLAADQRSCIDVDDCRSDACGDHACLNTRGSYSCVCKEGYEVIGGVCVAVDECAQSVCPQRCVNSADSFSCHCSPGFSLSEDGRSCVDVDECVADPCGFQCLNTPGSFVCFCPHSFRLDADGLSCSPGAADASTESFSRLGEGQTGLNATESLSTTPAELQHQSPHTDAPSPHSINITHEEESRGSNVSAGTSLSKPLNSRVLICVLGSVIPLLVLLAVTVAIAIFRCSRTKKEPKKPATADGYCWVPSGLDPRLEKLYESILTDDLIALSCFLRLLPDNVRDFSQGQHFTMIYGENMGCLRLSAAFVPLSCILTSFILTSVRSGVGTVDAPTCRAACVENDCVTVHLDRVDFKSAEERCREGNGELMAFQCEGAEKMLETLLHGVYGDLWIGLRLPGGVCSNVSAPLRGYQWTTGGQHRSFLPSSSTWKDGVEVCSPHCVSLSHDGKWTERLCSDLLHGFLCKTNHQHACQAQELSDPSFFLSTQRCSNFPCQHKCTDVRGGYTCSCRDGYIPQSQDPHLCQLHCPKQRCPVDCDRDGLCFCPSGFVRSDDFCVDYDECSMQNCDQECKNSFGSYICICREGFKLQDKGRCVPAKGLKGSTTAPPIITAAVNSTMKVSTSSTGTFLWIWICVAVAVVVCIFVIRYCVVKRLERQEYNSRQRPATHMDNMEI